MKELLSNIVTGFAGTTTVFPIRTCAAISRDERLSRLIWNEPFCADVDFLQQVCESGMPGLPHWSAIWRQQAISSSLICMPGRAQAMSGGARTINATNAHASLQGISTK